MSETSEGFERRGLSGFAALYEYASARGLTDTGSSSLGTGHNFAPACEHVKRVLYQTTGVWPSKIGYTAWKTFGDPSASFYFSGRRYVDGVVGFVPTPLYMTLLAAHLTAFEPDALTLIDIVAKELSQSVVRIDKERSSNGHKVRI